VHHKDHALANALCSIAFHFRHDFDDFAQRSRLLNSMAQQLTNIASTRGIAGAPKSLAPESKSVLLKFEWEPDLCQNCY
jgi:hypothetical protein